MDQDTANEVLACLCGERTLYTYYRDRYGIGLLSQLCRDGGDARLGVGALKKSPLAPLLQKPRVKAALAALGGDRLDAGVLAACDHDPAQEDFVLTLATWGSARRRERRWRQTSRPGYNLVLQLNFNGLHDRRCGRLGCAEAPFNYRAHPVSQRRNTLAWARIDLDWTSGSALIEEIQSDWIRRTAWLAARIERQLAAGRSPDAPLRVWGLGCSHAEARDYCAYVQERYAAIWAEAMLWAAIVFIRDDLGLRRIYYHSDSGGALLKGLRERLPPRSLYSELPRRFCMAPTGELPPLLAGDGGARSLVRQRPELYFFRLRTYEEIAGTLFSGAVQ